MVTSAAVLSTLLFPLLLGLCKISRDIDSSETAEGDYTAFSPFGGIPTKAYEKIIDSMSADGWIREATSGRKHEESKRNA
jgi:hypothetical protein